MKFPIRVSSLPALAPAFALSFLVSGWLAPSPAFGACAPDSTVVLTYGNGMYISPARARVQALMMDAKLRPALPSGVSPVFTYSYNNNEDDLTQVLEVVGQAIDDAVIRSQSWLNLPSGAPTSFRDAIRSRQQSARVGNYVKDSDLDAHVARYRADLEAGRRVIVLAHSQGNFYANRAHERLPSTAGFGIVAIGTPAGYTAGDGPYTTLTTDRIIDPIPGRRAPNTSNSAEFNASAGGSDGHSFTAHYLEGDVSGPKITGQVLSVLDAIGCPAEP